MSLVETNLYLSEYFRRLIMKEYINPDVIVDIYNNLDDGGKEIVEECLQSNGYDIDDILDEYEKGYLL